MKLRPYQQAAADAAIDWIKKSTESCVIEAETGAGKSLMIAEIAKHFTRYQASTYFAPLPMLTWCARTPKNI
jgi:superfamily II DNA or RNA helicase